MTDVSMQIKLSEMVEALRVELAVAAQQGKDAALRFEVGEVKLSATVEISRSTKGCGGVELWVVKGGAEHARSETVTHTVEVTLRPKHAGNDGPIEIAAADDDELHFPS